MKHISTGTKRGSFDLLAATRTAQAAMMTLRPGAASDDEPSNEHPQSEQWLFVIAGSGTATVGRRRVRLRKNSLLVIEKRERHRIENTGRRPLVTISFYSPPAYDARGQPRSQ